MKLKLDFNLFLTLFFLVTFIGLGFVFMNIQGPQSVLKKMGLAARADETLVVSFEKSLVYAYPIIVTGEDNHTSRITVFLRDAKDRPIPKKQVMVQSTLGTFIKTQGETDDIGKAEFELKSSTPGTATITASVDSKQIVSQKVDIEFAE